MIILRKKTERGQSLVEAAIVLPIIIFLILGAVQIMLLQHARVMSEYAAYNAARAGIVHNANPDVMRNAALLASLPIYQRTDDLPHFSAAWAKMKVLAEATEAADQLGSSLEKVTDKVVGDLLGKSFAGFLPDVSLVKVNVLSPTEASFDAAAQHTEKLRTEATKLDAGSELIFAADEIDFDDAGLMLARPDYGRLAIEVRLLAPLKIPLVNWMIFQLWYAYQELNHVFLGSDVDDWAAFQARIEHGEGKGKTLENFVRESEGRGVFDEFMSTQKKVKEARLLRELAVNLGIYLIPIHSSYAMQMQSNPFRDNVGEEYLF